MNAHLERPARSAAVRKPPRPPRPPNLTTLVALAAAGDPSSWDAIVERFSPLVWRVARTYGLSETDVADVFQSTWLHLIEHVGHVREPERLAGWLVTATRREALRVLKQNGRTRPVEEPALNIADPAAEAIVIILLAERDEVIRRAFRSLSEDDQLLLTLLVSDPPVSYQEIADSLGMAIGSIGPTRARALGRLRQAIERLGQGDLL
jgi:RNA polymerase sigma factor (sigma-70 family)